MIHLWNIRRGKTLRVGSIALLKAGGHRQSRRLRLTEPLRLLLRCLLIILAAVLLSRPVWQQRPRQKEKGWVLLPGERWQETYQHFQLSIDSLLQAGYALHYFNPGFRAAGLTATFYGNMEMDSTMSYWALLDSLQQMPGAPRSFFIFTPAWLHRFRGQRPAIDTGVHWYAYTPADSVATWPGNAYATPSGSIYAGRVSSRPGGNSYAWEILPFGAAPQPVDTTTMRITLFADALMQDALYLKAAITAIQQFTQHRLALQEVHQTTALPAQTDWLFWLSTQPLPRDVQARNTWRYDTGQVVNSASWIISGTAAPVPLYKRVQPPLTAAEAVPLWQDGFGNPILRQEKGPQTTQYHFASRLDPAWNELPWQADFPAMLLQLLFPDSNNVITGKDRRIIAAQQLQPDHTAGNMITRSRTAAITTDLSPFCWALLLLLFLIERLWAFRVKKLPADG